MNRKRNRWIWIRFLISCLLTTAYCLLPSDSTAHITFEKTYGGISNDGGYSVSQTADGGYVITGYTFSFGAGAYDVYLIKTDSLGDTLWAKTYGGTFDDYGYSVKQTTDGGYFIAGSTNSFGAGGPDVYLIKTNSLGDTLWTKIYGGTSFDEVYLFQQTSDDGYIIAGRTYSFGAGGSDVYLIKTNSLGDTVWTKTFGGTSFDEGWSVQQTTDGGYVIAGYTNSFGAGGSDIYLIKTNSLGDTLWTKTFGGTSSEEGFSVHQTSDNGYIVAGGTYSFGAGLWDVYLIKTDSSGDTLWSKTYGGNSTELGYSVQQTSDGGYFIAGNTYSFGAGSNDVYLIKTDSLGDTVWTRTFGGTSPDAGISVNKTSDGGYIIAGYTNSFGAGGYDVYLVKPEVWGPEPLSAVAFDNVNPFPGIDEDDEVLITFDEPTNKPPITSSNINSVLRLSGGHSWTDTLGFFGSAVWNPTGDRILITFSTTFGLPTITVGDTITPDGVTIRDQEGNRAVAPIILTGTFDPSDIHDVGVISIDAPQDTIIAEDTVEVRATVSNFGTIPQTFQVLYSVAGESDSQTVTNLAPGDSFQINYFTPWRVPSLPCDTPYSLTVTTFLGTDFIPGNNTGMNDIFARCPFHDVGVTGFLSVPDTVDTGSIVIISSIVENFGDYLESFNVQLTIDGIADTQTVTSLLPGSLDTVTFDPWTAPSFSCDTTFSIIATVILGTDIDPGNDILNQNIVVVCPPDIEPPIITHTPPDSTINEGNSILISSNITDNVSVDSATLFYREGGASTFSSTSMTNPVGDTWQGTIPSTPVTERGVEYYIHATDGANSANSPFYPIIISATVDTTIPTSVWRMISVPVNPINGNPKSILEDDLGPYDNTIWRLFRWSGNGYSEYPSLPYFAPGRGYWIQTRGSNSIDASGTSTFPNDSNYYRIPLDPGWNQIGNPYAFDVDLDLCWVRKGGIARAIVDTSWVENRLVEYINGYADVFQFKPWSGYWVKNITSEIVDLLVPQKEAGTLLAGDGEGKLPKFLKEPEWRLKISVSCGESKDSENFLGVSKVARDGWDMHDFSEPPVIGDYVSLYFPHEEWKDHPGRYGSDIKAGIRGQGSGVSWKFNIETNLSDETVEITWKTEFLPEDLEIVLMDLSGDVVLDMRGETGYSFYSTKGKRNFEIKVGKDLFQPNLSGLLIIPLMLSYPNPAQGSAVIRMEIETDAVIKARIFNLLGQTIQWIDSEKVERKGLNPTGTAYVYEFRWDGRDTAGKVVRSGIYFYEIEAEDKWNRTKRIGKLILIR